MSFTFKKMLNSLNRSESQKSASKDHETKTMTPDHGTTTIEQSTDGNEPNNLVNGFHRRPNSEINGLSLLRADNKDKRSLSKRGKKKLAAMVGLLNSSIINQSRSGKPINGGEAQVDGNNIVKTEETDEDEEFSEPLCQDGFDGFSTDQGDETRSNSVHATHGHLATDSSVDKAAADEDDNKAELMPEEECDIPTFLHTKDCDKRIIETTRVLLRERFAKNPDNFYENDYRRMLEDDWTVSRFLLRRRLDPKRTAKLMEECGRFRKQYKMSEVQLWEFPIEFHKAGGLFKYAPDRVGNLTVYMRVKMYRRVPEISDVFKAFILCVLEQADVENKGRGVAIVFDLSACGLQNVDLGFLSWLLSSFRNYCPKGVSYILVYNLPWILSTTCRMAMSWMSATNRRALRFAHGDEIENFIAKENLPDYCGGTCKINYRSVPEASKRAVDVCEQLDITREQALKIKELFKEYLSDDDDDEHDESTSKKKKKIKNKKLDKKMAPSYDARPRDYDPSKDTQESTIQNMSTLNGHPLGPSTDLVSQASKFIA